VTLASFTAWKRKKIEEKKRALKAAKKDKKDKIKLGRTNAVRKLGACCCMPGENKQQQWKPPPRRCCHVFSPSFALAFAVIPLHLSRPLG